MFCVRNVGNMIPNADKVNHEATATEPAALELGKQCLTQFILIVSLFNIK